MFLIVVILLRNILNYKWRVKLASLKSWQAVVSPLCFFILSDFHLTWRSDVRSALWFRTGSKASELKKVHIKHRSCKQAFSESWMLFRLPTNRNYHFSKFIFKSLPQTFTSLQRKSAWSSIANTQVPLHTQIRHHFFGSQILSRRNIKSIRRISLKANRQWLALV